MIQKLSTLSQQQLDKVQISSIRVGDSVIKALDFVRYLGAYFDLILSMGPHIDAKCGATFRQLFSIRHIRRFLSREATETLIHAFIFCDRIVACATQNLCVEKKTTSLI